MKKIPAILLTLVCCALFMGSAMRSAPVLPSRSFYVNDYADIVSAERRDSMLNIAHSVYEITGAQIVLLTVDSLGGFSPEEYAESIFQGWGIGGVEGAGVLLLVSKKDNEAYILAGQGIRKALTEDRAAGIRDEKLIASFAKGEYTEGIYNGYKDVAAAVFAGYGAEASFEEDSGGSANFGSYAIFMAGVVLIAIRGFRISMRTRKRYASKKYVYKRKTYKRELRADEDDYPSGFGGAIRIKVREPEDGDIAGTTEENRTDDERT